MSEPSDDSHRVAIINMLTALLNDSRNLTGLVVVAYRQGQLLFPSHVNMTPQQFGAVASLLQAEATRYWMRAIEQRDAEQAKADKQDKGG